MGVQACHGTGISEEVIWAFAVADSGVCETVCQAVDRCVAIPDFDIDLLIPRRVLQLAHYIM